MIRTIEQRTPQGRTRAKEKGGAMGACTDGTGETVALIPPFFSNIWMALHRSRLPRGAGTPMLGEAMTSPEACNSSPFYEQGMQ